MPAARLSGRVVAEGANLRGATVELEQVGGVYRATATTNDDGSYTFERIPPGDYHLRARTVGPLPLAASPGRSPVQVARGAAVWVGLQAVPAEVPSFADFGGGSVPGFGALRGVARWKGEPAAGVVATLYLDEAEALKGPGFRQAIPTGTDGSYLFDELPEGSYFLVLRRRGGGTASGPLREGDLYAAAPANPVPVRPGQETVLDVHLVRKEKDEDPNEGSLALGRTGVHGRVIDEKGRPVAGVFVFAYRNRTIGHGMPDHVSLPTGVDGSFRLSVREGGLVYMGARERSGGSPEPGEFFGLYEGAADHSLHVPRGQVVGPVDLVVRRVLEP